MEAKIYKDLRHNIIVNLTDGGFFGLALGFASFTTVLPLFVSTMTDSAILIGLIPGIHNVGWMLPQLFLAEHLSRVRRFKPVVMKMTINERLPFIGLMLVALSLPRIGNKAALLITFALLIWQGFGGGLAANAWQSMMAKVMSLERLGTFYGLQSAAANLLMSGSAVLAGIFLEQWESPLDYTILFGLASISFLISFTSLGLTREPEGEPLDIIQVKGAFWGKIGGILRKDRNFRWFLVFRSVSYLAIMAFSFYIVYAVRVLQMSEGLAGIMMGVFTFTQIIANPLMGWLGDRWNHPALMKIGSLAAAGSALIAMWAPSLSWFYIVFVLAGIANVALWTIGLVVITQFGSDSERPAYIGMANTLVAPFAILAPIFGGWLADLYGYNITFLASAICSLAAMLILQFGMQDPKQVKLKAQALELTE